MSAETSATRWIASILQHAKSNVTDFDQAGTDFNAIGSLHDKNLTSPLEIMTLIEPFLSEKQGLLGNC